MKHNKTIVLTLGLLLGPLGSALAAGTIETPGCQRQLTAATSNVGQTLAQLKVISKSTGEQTCMAYRNHFMTIVNARAVIAACKTSPDREQDVGRLDGAIEDINNAIAQRCAGI